MKTKILHITPHLGGGAGRVLSRVAIYRKNNESQYEDSFLCIEPTEKTELVDEMIAHKIKIYTMPQDVDSLINNSDIVQIEWWHHPLIVKFVSEHTMKARLVVWCHTSGSCYPKIPRDFVTTPHAFMFTTSASLGMFRGLPRRSTIGVACSSGGFADMPLIQRKKKLLAARCSYIGTLGFSKLHPDILEFLNSVDEPSFVVNFYGNETENPGLGKSNKILLKGFVRDISSVLKNTEVLVYLLNPTHYGTTENSLIEAMAMGVVPVVFNNKVESSIVEHGVTGFVVSSREEFSKTMKMLDIDQTKRLEFSSAASKVAREKYSLQNTVSGLDEYYKLVMKKKKRQFILEDIFGCSPGQWFSSGLGKLRDLFARGRRARKRYPVLYEKSKSSAFQFLKYFPGDTDIKYFVDILKKDIAHEK